MTLPAAYLAEFEEPDGYIEFASTGPVSRRVRAAVAGALDAVAAPTGHAWEEVTPRYEAALEAMARFMGVPVERVTPIPSTSAGLFQTAFGLLGAGGNVVLPSHEFPANVYPWLRAAEAGGPEVRMVDVPDGRTTPERLQDAVDPDTRAVAVSLVDYQTGFRIDLEGMRALAGDALLVVDAIQGLGAVHRGLGPADVMVAGGQKWMRAGWGSGVMAASDRSLERLAPVLTGWLGVADPLDSSIPPPHPIVEGAGRFQEGTPPLLGTVRFGAAIEVIELAGIEAISGAVGARCSELEEVLRRAGAEVRTPWQSAGERAGILCFRLPGEAPEDTHDSLLAAGVTTSHRGEWVRLSPHASTSAVSVSMLAAALGVGD